MPLFEDWINGHLAEHWGKRLLAERFTSAVVVLTWSFPIRLQAVKPARSL